MSQTQIDKRIIQCKKDIKTLQKILEELEKEKIGEDKKYPIISLTTNNCSEPRAIIRLTEDMKEMIRKHLYIKQIVIDKDGCIQHTRNSYKNSFFYNTENPIFGGI